MKTILSGVLVLFVGFWLVQAPQGAAAFAQDAATWAWEMTSRLFTSVIDFLSALFR